MVFPAVNVRTPGVAFACAHPGSPAGEMQRMIVGSELDMPPHGARLRQVMHHRTRALLVLALTALIVAGIPAPAAQAATCAIPGGASATPGTTSSTGAVIDGEGEAASTPGALPLATPMATPAAPRDILHDELSAAADALAACLSTGDSATVIELAGERYLGQLFGSSVPLSAADYQAITAELRPVPVRIESVDEATLTDNDRASAVVTQVVGNQVLRATWFFERAPRGARRADQNPWKLSYERALPIEIPANATEVAVELSDFDIRMDSTDIEGPIVVLRGENVAKEDHEMLVLRLEDGATTDDLLQATGPDLPPDIIFSGEVPVRGEQQQDLLLVDLEPGTYAVVCLFPDADGVPHLTFGMEEVFTIS